MARRRFLRHRIRALAIATACVLTFNAVCVPPALGQASSKGDASLKKQLASVLPGTVVEVKLRQKNSPKIRGELGPLAEEDFEIRTVTARNDPSAPRGMSFRSEKIAYADVKSVKVKPVRAPRRGGGTSKTLAVIGGIVAVVLVVAAMIDHFRRDTGL